MRILVTGAAGFIGSHLCERLLSSGHDLIAIDNFSDFYDPALKRKNIDEVAKAASNGERDFILCEGDIRDAEFVAAVFGQERPEGVIHLAASAGVRPSILDPLLYEAVNIHGTMHLLQTAKEAGVRPFIFASSSSVYGNNPKVPFSESDPVDNPISPYAATKKAGELICYVYHHLYRMNIACLRFFTVYGPRQRPDLAIHKFTRLIDHGKTIPFYGDGTTSRDYTFIADIIDGVEKAFAWVCTDECRYDIFNLGGSKPVALRRLVEIIEDELGKPAKLEMLPLQPGDVERTYADLTKSAALLGFRPSTAIEDGIRSFVKWYRENSGKE